MILFDTCRRPDNSAATHPARQSALSWMPGQVMQTSMNSSRLTAVSCDLVDRYVLSVVSWNSSSVQIFLCSVHPVLPWHSFDPLPRLALMRMITSQIIYRVCIMCPQIFLIINCSSPTGMIPRILGLFDGFISLYGFMVYFYFHLTIYILTSCVRLSWLMRDLNSRMRTTLKYHIVHFRGNLWILSPSYVTFVLSVIVRLLSATVVEASALRASCVLCPWCAGSHCRHYKASLERWADMAPLVI